MMSERSRFAKEPLLYIQQPTISHPNAPMQSFYTTPKQSSNTPTNKTEAKTPQKKTKKRPANLGAFTKGIVEDLKEPQVMEKQPTNHVEIDTEIESSEEQQVEKKTTDRKKFKEMSLMEKVEYFVNTPKHLPRMRCEVKTEEKTYRGVIRDFEENQVLMQVGRRVSNTKISFEDINDIRLLGF